MMLPINGSKNHSPQIAVIGGSSPASTYILPTSSAMTNITTGLIKMANRRSTFGIVRFRHPAFDLFESLLPERTLRTVRIKTLERRGTVIR